MKVEQTRGLIAAPYSPLKKDGTLNPDAVKSYAELLIRNNVKGAFICGSSGEGLSLTLDERKELAQQWVKHANKKLKIIVHVGSTSINYSQELAEHALKSGADAIASIDPIYYLKPWLYELAEYFREISSAAPGLPFYSYYIPVLTHYETDYLEFCEKAVNIIPDFAGVKYTFNNLFEFTQLKKSFGDTLDILFGTDELLINALASGATGAVGSTYNFMPSLYYELIENFSNGNIRKARDLQIVSQNIISLMQKYHGSIVFGKAVMNLIGIDCGPVRSPLKNLSDKEITQLAEDLENLSFAKIKAI